MIVVHVTNSVMSGGVGTMIRALIYEQSRSGITPIVLTNGNELEAFKKWCKIKKINISFYPIEEIRIKKMTITGGLSRKMYNRLLKNSDGEQMIFHFHNPISVGLFSYIPKDSVCTLHGFIGRISNKVLSNKIVYMTIKRMIKKNVQMIGCCNAVAEYFNSLFRTDCFKGILNGIEEYEKGINKYIKKSNKIKIGFASHIDELKGWNIIEEAYNLMKHETRSMVEFYFAGEIAEESLYDFEKFSQNSNVKYVGYIDDAKENFIPYLDVLVLPSRTEGLPMCLLEAMKSNVIIIATDVGGIGEIVEDGVSGFLIKRSGEALCDVLEKIINDPILFSRLKQNFELSSKQDGSAKKMSKEYKMLYDSL